jgi:hypothetical protein
MTRSLTPPPARRTRSASRSGRLRGRSPGLLALDPQPLVSVAEAQTLRARADQLLEENKALARKLEAAEERERLLKGQLKQEQGRVQKLRRRLEQYEGAGALVCPAQALVQRCEAHLAGERGSHLPHVLTAARPFFDRLVRYPAHSCVLYLRFLVDTQAMRFYLYVGRERQAVGTIPGVLRLRPSYAEVAVASVRSRKQYETALASVMIEEIAGWSWIDASGGLHAMRQYGVVLTTLLTLRHHDNDECVDCGARGHGRGTTAWDAATRRRVDLCPGALALGREHRVVDLAIPGALTADAATQTPRAERHADPVGELARAGRGALVRARGAVQLHISPFPSQQEWRRLDVSTRADPDALLQRCWEVDGAGGKEMRGVIMRTINGREVFALTPLARALTGLSASKAKAWVQSSLMPFLLKRCPPDQRAAVGKDAEGSEEHSRDDVLVAPRALVLAALAY